MKTYLAIGKNAQKSGSLRDCLSWAKQRIDSGDCERFDLARQRAGEAEAKIVLQIDSSGISQPRSDSFIKVGTAFTYE